MRDCVVFIHDPDMMLTFDLYMVIRVSLVSFTHSFYFVNIDFIKLTLKHSFQLKILDPLPSIDQLMYRYHLPNILTL